MWSVLPEPMVASMYLWEVKNPEDFSQGAKPVLEERGPYVFTEQHYKTNITWNDNNGTVTYKQIRKWNFVPELSNGKYFLQSILIKWLFVCVFACLSGTFSYIVTYFCVTITQVLVRAFTTRGKQQPIQLPNFVS